MFACLYSPSPDAGEVLERVARDFSPRIEIQPKGFGHPGRVVLLDASGLERLLGDPATIGRELWTALQAHLERAAAPSAGVALALTRVAARLLACARPGLTIIEPGHDALAIAVLPIDALRGLGAPPDLFVTLERWGISTLGAFAALPAPRLSARLGQDGVRWQRIARGDDPHPLVPSTPEERFEEMLDLEWPIEGIEPLSFVLGRLLDPLCARLERRGRAVAALTLQLRQVVTRSWDRRRLELPSPSRDVRMLRTLLCLNLEGCPPEGGLDRVAVFIEPTPARACQFSLLAKPTLAPEHATTLMARLRALLGHDRCGTPQLVDTHRPGAFTMGELNPSPPQPRKHENTKKAGRGGLRRLRHPIPAHVIVEHGRPVRVTTDRRGWSGGRVIWAAGPWRSSGEWWKTDDSMGAWNQETWDVALSDGGLYRIHEDRLRAQWAVEAVLD